MKKCILLLFLVVSLPLFAEESKNLVKNPSFTEISADGMPKFWGANIRKGPGGVPKCIFKQVKEGQDDQSAMSINVPERNKSKAMAELFQHIRVKPNTKYYFSVYLKAVRSGAWPNVCLEFRDSRMKQMGHTGTKPENGDKGKDYTLYECSFKTKPNQKYVTISMRLQNLGCGEVYFDNAFLIELEN